MDVFLSVCTYVCMHACMYLYMSQDSLLLTSSRTAIPHHSQLPSPMYTNSIQSLVPLPVPISMPILTHHPYILHLPPQPISPHPTIFTCYSMLAPDTSNPHIQSLLHPYPHPRKGPSHLTISWEGFCTFGRSVEGPILTRPFGRSEEGLSCRSQEGPALPDGLPILLCMCMCVYMYICLYVCVCMHAFMCVCIYICL